MTNVQNHADYQSRIDSAKKNLLLSRIFFALFVGVKILLILYLFGSKAQASTLINAGPQEGIPLGFLLFILGLIWWVWNLIQGKGEVTVDSTGKVFMANPVDIYPIPIYYEVEARDWEQAKKRFLKKLVHNPCRVKILDEGKKGDFLDVVYETGEVEWYEVSKKGHKYEFSINI